MSVASLAEKLKPRTDSNVVLVWIPPPMVRDLKLNSEEKKSYMTETVVSAYRLIVEEALKGIHGFVIRFDELTAEGESRQFCGR